MNVVAEIIETDGREALHISFANKGVEIREPTPETIEIACEVLMMNLAGISKGELVTAGMMALIDA